MSDPFFFGYGSLVNTRTHDYPETHPARVSGYVRSWRHTNRRPFAYLSIVPKAQGEISGLIARVPNDDWKALDLREAGYGRAPLSPEKIVHDRDGATEVQTYQTLTEGDLTGRAQYPILLSYLDVVVQGFRDIFGEQGVAAFFASTEGWEAGFLNDRKAPLYPRHQVLSPLERQLVDHHVSRLPAQVEQL